MYSVYVSLLFVVALIQRIYFFQERYYAGKPCMRIHVMHVLTFPGIVRSTTPAYNHKKNVQTLGGTYTSCARYIMYCLFFDVCRIPTLYVYTRKDTHLQKKFMKKK